nr:EOG090X0JCO [Eulimnadia texana]
MASVVRHVVLLSQRNYNCLRRAHISSFKSSLSLDKLYPHSKLDITSLPKIPESVGGKFTGYIPIDKLQISYSRSSGPGGQNVNTVSSKVEVRFHLQSAEWIPENVRTKLSQDLLNQLTKEGSLIVKSDKTRSQQLNLADALNKLRRMIYAASESLAPAQPSAESIERQRRLREKAARERLREKRQNSFTKQGRQAPTLD